MTTTDHQLEDEAAQLPAGGRTIYLASNASGDVATATFAPGVNPPCQRAGLGEFVVSIDDGAAKAIGPLETMRFGDPVSVTVAGALTITVVELDR